jgi:hypothetical protein
MDGSSVNYIHINLVFSQKTQNVITSLMTIPQTTVTIAITVSMILYFKKLSNKF